MKIGISIKIDVSKIDKARLFKGEKGNYLDLTTFIDTDEAGQYGDHGFISQSVTKDERAQGINGNILGNCKVFFTEGTQQAPPPQQAPQQQQYAQQAPPQNQQQPVQQQQNSGVFPEDDIPF